MTFDEILTEDRYAVGAWCTSAVRGKSKRKSTWAEKLIGDSFEVTEQGQVFRADLVFDPEPIGQFLGMDARCKRMGQSDLPQHDAEAQHDFAPAFKASGNTACAHQRVSAASRNHALCCRSIPPSYHRSETQWAS